MSQNYHYPSDSSASSNPSVSANGAPIPGSSTLVAGENPSGNQQPLQTDASGNLFVSVTGSSTQNVNLIQVSGAAITLGQKVSASSLPVVLASDETVPISATALPLPAGASTSALQTSGNASLSSIDSKLTNPLPISGTVSVSNFPATQPVSGTVTANQGTSPWVENVSQINGITPLMGNGVTGTGSLRVTLASDTTSNSNPFLVTPNTSSTATLSNVASSATSVTLLSSNAARKGMTIFNDSTQVLYVKFGTTASATSYTVQIASMGYYELPFFGLYTGRIDGIWAAANGNARMTEMT